MNRAELEALSLSVRRWYHSIDLGQGVVTNGVRPAAELASALRRLQLPDLRRKTVLDIGAWDGYFSFVAERMGATKVVALDHYVWSFSSLADLDAYFEEMKRQGRPMPPPHTLPQFWHPDPLPGKAGFDAARRALGSAVMPMVADFMATDPADVGRFDVVLYLGVLYHMENPLEAMKRVAAVTGELAVIETAAVAVPGYEHVPICEFFPSDELVGDPTNWWAPNLAGLVGLCRAAGFGRVEVIQGPEWRARWSRLAGALRFAFAETGLGRHLGRPKLRPEVIRYRAMVHARP